MSITTIAALTGTAAVAAGSGTGFTAAGPFILYGDNFSGPPGEEYAALLRKGPSGAFKQATNKQGLIFVSSSPNFVYVDCGGDYQIRKTATAVESTVGYAEV